MVKKILKKTKTKRKKLTENFNVKKIKKLIKEELYTNYSKNEKKYNENIFDSILLNYNKDEKEKEYNIRYSKYIVERFNSTLVYMLINYINNNNSFPKDFQLEPNFIYKLINLMEHLFINEIELVNLTLLIDKIGWKHQTIDHWTYFCILGIYIKKIFRNEEESNLLINYFQIKNNKFIDFYKMICDEEIKKKFDIKELTIKTINKRFKQLTKPINLYCKQNFINYNVIVDKIVYMSQPYGEESNGIQLYNNEYLKFDKGKKIDLAFNLEGNYKSSEIFSNAQNNNRDANEIINNNYVPTSNSNFDKELLKNNLNSINFDNRSNNIDFNNQSCYFPSLNIVNKPSFQFSLKNEGDVSNSNFNNFI